MIYGSKPIGTIGYLGGVLAVAENFCWSMVQMVQYNAAYLVDPGEHVVYDHVKVSYHAYARNALVERMRGDWLLQLDTDHEFEPDLAARLVRVMMTHDIDVLTGMYVYKQHPHNPVVFTRDGDRIGYIGDWDRNVDIFEVGSAGGGCLLVRRRVFDRIQRELHENPFEIRKSFSEDNSFFDRCHDLGIKAYCCPAIESPHLRVQPVTLADYDPDPALLGPRQEVQGRRFGA